MSNTTTRPVLEHVEGNYKPQVDLFNSIIDRINGADDSNESLATALNSAFSGTTGTFTYTKATGGWTFTPKNA